MNRSGFHNLLRRVLVGLSFVCWLGWQGTSAGIVSVAAAPEETRRQFAITQLEDGFKTIRDANNRVFLLAPRGKAIPQQFSKMPVIRIPLQRALFTSPTQVCCLRPFADREIWRSVVGVTTPEEEWFLDPIRRGLGSGAITYLGDSMSPDFERMRLLRPEVAFVYTGPSGQFRLIKGLRTLGIPYIVDNDYLEPDLQGRLEWVKFMAAFYGKDREASAYVQAAAKRSLGVGERVRGLPRPKVLWSMIYDGKVYVPSSDSFVARMIQQAGGEYLIRTRQRGGNLGNINISLEEFYQLARRADIYISPTFPTVTPNIAALVQNAPVLAELAVIKQKRVWCLQPWYNQLLDRSDEVVADLAALCHPEAFPQTRLRHFVKLR